MGNIRKIAAVVFALSALCAIGCSSVTGNVRLTSSSVLPQRDASIWAEADTEEKSILKQDTSYRDPALDAYLAQVVSRLRPADAPSFLRFRVHVLRDVDCNAFALPNGAVFVNTGLLSRLDNEAELAVLFGHEMSHVLYRHSALKQNQADESAKTSRTLSVLADLLGGVIAKYAVEEISFRSFTSSYSRDMEREADMEGFRLAEKSGYDMTQAPNTFRHLIKDLEDFGGDGSSLGMYSSHPALVDRIDSYNELIKDYHGVNGIVREREYRAVVRGVFLDTIREEAAVSRYRVAAEFARRYMTSYPGDPLGYCLAADIMRKEKGIETDRNAVRELYMKALTADPRCSDALRGMGLESYRSGNRAEAGRYLSSYLAVRPDAWDREYIKGYLRESK